MLARPGRRGSRGSGRKTSGILVRTSILRQTGSRSMRPGNVCLANFPFGDTAALKLRPVLLLTGPVGPVPEILVAYISSVVPPTLLASDILVDPSKPEGSSTGPS